MKNIVLDCNNAYKQRNERMNSMKKGILLFSLVILVLGILSISAVFALTASIGNPRMVLYENITGDKLVFNDSVMVNNKNNYSVNITITPNGDWTDRVTISEPEFVLDKEERKEVYWAVCELVKQRIEKARSLRE